MTAENETIRTKLARMVRRVGEWSSLPDWAWFPVQRLAYAIAPHSLTCRVCGARFVQPAFGSKAHASRAYDHYVDVHEEARA